jgi:hypothetical protein
LSIYLGIGKNLSVSVCASKGEFNETRVKRIREVM